MHPTRARTVKPTLLAGACPLFAWLALATSQVSENQNDSGASKIAYLSASLSHPTDASFEGATAFLRAFDSCLFYQPGRDLVQRPFVLANGVNDRSGSLTFPLGN